MKELCTVSQIPLEKKRGIPKLPLKDRRNETQNKSGRNHEGRIPETIPEEFWSNAELILQNPRARILERIHGDYFWWITEEISKMMLGAIPEEISEGFKRDLWVDNWKSLEEQKEWSLESWKTFPVDSRENPSRNLNRYLWSNSLKKSREESQRNPWNQWIFSITSGGFPR